MDYEKLYKEALEKARKTLEKSSAKDAAKLVVEYFFPELAESEDEEIRKEIIGALMWQRDCLDAKGPHDNKLILPGFTMKVGDILEWLEKQKEQKPELPLMGGDTDTYFDDLRMTTKSLTSREWFNEGIKYAQRLQKEQHPSSRFLPNDWVVYDGPLGHAILQVKDVVAGRYSFVDNVSTLLEEDSDKFLRPLTPKDVEKPAEWSDTNELVFKDICKHLKEEGYSGWVVLLEALHSGEFQPKQEWSEEDEKQIAQIERICKNAGCSKMLQEKIHNWFDSLCFKMVKWDNNMMNIRNSIREVLYKEKRCPNTWFTYLEHCGPQTKYAYWKPTEDQMEAIKHAYNSFPNDCSTKSNLMFLYRDLKKLM